MTVPIPRHRAGSLIKSSHYRIAEFVDVICTSEPQTPIPSSVPAHGYIEARREAVTLKGSVVRVDPPRRGKSGYRKQRTESPDPRAAASSTRGWPRGRGLESPLATRRGARKNGERRRGSWSEVGRRNEARTRGRRSFKRLRTRGSRCERELPALGWRVCSIGVMGQLVSYRGSSVRGTERYTGTPA